MHNTVFPIIEMNAILSVPVHDASCLSVLSENIFGRYVITNLFRSKFNKLFYVFLRMLQRLCSLFWVFIRGGQ